MSGVSETVRVGSNMPEIAEGKQEEEGKEGREGEDFEKCAMSSSHRQHSGRRGVQKLRSELAEHSLFKLPNVPYRIGLAKSKELRNQKSYYYRQL